MVKMLITGTRRGLGKALKLHFNADGVDRVDGFDLSNIDSLKAVAKKSLEYDVFINNAFEGPAAAEYSNFGQTKLLYEVFYAWEAANKTGHIFNIGSIGEKIIKPPIPMAETVWCAKAALAHASKQCTVAFKENKVPFKTTLLTMAKLDVPHMRGDPDAEPGWQSTTWTGNGIDVQNIANAINFSLGCTGNTVVEEITLLLNLYYQHK